MPKVTSETRERLTGIVTYMQPGDFVLFFDAGAKENLLMCHEVVVNAQRSQKNFVKQISRWSTKSKAQSDMAESAVSVVLTMLRQWW